MKGYIFTIIGVLTGFIFYEYDIITNENIELSKKWLFNNYSRLIGIIMLPFGFLFFYIMWKKGNSKIQ